MDRHLGQPSDGTSPLYSQWISPTPSASSGPADGTLQHPCASGHRDVEWPVETAGNQGRTIGSGWLDNTGMTGQCGSQWDDVSSSSEEDETMDIPGGKLY